MNPIHLDTLRKVCKDISYSLMLLKAYFKQIDLDTIDKTDLAILIGELEVTSQRSNDLKSHLDEYLGGEK